MRVTMLDATHVASYRALMLEAFEQAADAFTTTAAERRAEPEAWWISRIGSAVGLASSFGAWDGGNLVGCVALAYSGKPKTRHSACVLGMYVRPAYRSKGVGRMLMDAAIHAALARPEVRVLTLTVTQGNEPALRLYRAVGFDAWGVEPLAIRTESGLSGKVHMSLELSWPPVATEFDGADRAG